MKKKKELIVIGALILLLLGGAVVILFATNANKEKEQDVSSFAAYTDFEMFQNVPVMAGENIVFSEARDVGGDNYMITAENTTLSEYKEYLVSLEKNGFTKYVNNGKEGIEGDVYMAHYQKDSLLITTTYFANLQNTMINVTKDEVLSPNLFYDESHISNNIDGAQTTFHSPELYNVGNSYIFQLKNGHFLLSDGGTAAEMPYLLDYLESLVPEGEKPVIDAWFITHSHTDHMGILQAVMEKPEYAERIYVESVYFNEPPQEAAQLFETFDNCKLLITYSKNAATFFKSSDGSTPETYRPRMGEKYYFNDITVDVIYSQELLEPSKWMTWNASCYVMTFNIEGQKVLITADADWECQKLYMDIFDSTYFNLAVYQAPHHGKNVFTEFAYHCNYIGTIVYPTYVIGSAASGEDVQARTVQNLYFQSKAEESLTYADGTKVFTFPYEVGTVKSLPSKEWIYNSTAPSWKENKQ